MNFALKMAWTYFRARRKSLARLTTIIAVVGIAAGVSSLILAQALARGFSNEMREKILNSTAHISVFLTSGDEIQNWLAIKKDLEKLENVRRVAPTTYESVLVTGDKTTGYAILKVESPPEKIQSPESAVQSQNAEIQNPKSKIQNPQALDSIEVGAELAEKAGLRAGGEAEIIIPQPNNFAPRSVQVRVAKTFRTGLYDYDSTWIRASPESFARMQGRADFAPTILNVTVEDVYSADKTAQRMREILPPDFRVLDWQEANRPLFAALSLERKAALAVISLIIFIAVLNITTTLALLAGERRLDIAVLRTCGAKTRGLISIFLFEGFLLGLTGIILGIILGLAGCFIGNYFRLISLAADVYALSYIPLIPSFGDVLLTAAIAFILSLTAAIYPAWRASGIKPLENLRNV